MTRPTVRIGLPEEDKVGTWIVHNHLLDLNKELTTEAEKILQTALAWLRKCGIHTKLDPVLGRCSWEENSSVCNCFRQTHKAPPHLTSRTVMRINTCAMINKLQSLCWSDNEAFQVENVEVVGFLAHKQRLEVMITIEYLRTKPPLPHAR